MVVSQLVCETCTFLAPCTCLSVSNSLLKLQANGEVGFFWRGAKRKTGSLHEDLGSTLETVCRFARGMPQNTLGVAPCPERDKELVKILRYLMNVYC